MHFRLVRHVSSSGSIRVLATSLDQHMATVAELADLYHGRWRIEEAFKRLKHRLGLESVSTGGCGHQDAGRQPDHAAQSSGAAA